MRTVEFQNQEGATVQWRPVSDRTEAVIQQFPPPRYGRTTQFTWWPGSVGHIYFAAQMLHHAGEGESWPIATRHAMGRVESWGDLEMLETASIQRLYQALGFPGNVSGEPGATLTVERDGITIPWRPLDDRTVDVLKAFPPPVYEVRTALNFWPGVKRQVWFRAQLIHHETRQERVIATAHAAGLLAQCKDFEILETRAIQRLYGAIGFGGEIFDPDEDRDRASLGTPFPWDEEPGTGKPGPMGQEEMTEYLRSLVQQ